MNTPRFRDALLYAAELHAAQTRKASDTPYIAHLLAVAAIVLEHGGNEDEAIAAGPASRGTAAPRMNRLTPLAWPRRHPAAH